jgi:hypothetical protein
VQGDLVLGNHIGDVGLGSVLTTRLSAAVAGVLVACADTGESASRADSVADTHSAAPSAQQSPATDVASVGNTTVHLANCRATVQVSGRASNASAAIPLPGPCRFVVDTNGKAQVVNTAAGRTLLVMSATPLPQSRFCDTRVRAIVVRDGHVAVSEGEQRIRSCATGPFDTKMFHVLMER